jgi:hypothetical protein
LLSASVYCESYELNLSTEIKSCSIEDTPCSNDQDSSVFCEVCPGGQTVSATALCNDQNYPIINCTDNYMNSSLYSYQIENNAQITKDGESDSAMCQANVYNLRNEGELQMPVYCNQRPHGFVCVASGLGLPGDHARYGMARRK